MVGRPAQGFTMYHEKDDQKQIAKFSKDLLEGEVFGFDIEVPENFMTSLAKWRYCLLFKRCLIVIYLKK